MCKAIGIVFEYVLNASTLPVIVFEYDVRHSAQCSLCKARSIVFEYVRRRRLNCREPKAEVKIYRYNKTLAATDNHRPFPSLGHDTGDDDGDKQHQKLSTRTKIIQKDSKVSKSSKNLQKVQKCIHVKQPQKGHSITEGAPHGAKQK